MYGGIEDRKDRIKVTFFSAWAEVVREKEIWKLGLVYFMFGFSYIIYMTFFVAYLTGEIGLTPQKAGKIFAVLGFFSIVSGILWGWVSDVLGRKYGLLLAYCTFAVACLLGIYWKTVPGFYVSSIIFGITLSSTPSIIAAAIGDSMGGKLAPAALGFATLLFGIGQSLAPAVAGLMKDATGTFAGCFVLSAAVFLFGAGGCLLLRKKER